MKSPERAGASLWPAMNVRSRSSLFILLGAVEIVLGLIAIIWPAVAAVSIAMHLVYFAPAIVFGLYYFLHGDISIERFRSLLSSEHAVEEIESESPNGQSQVSSP